jgi:mono/diheme cytochrome c family protein
MRYKLLIALTAWLLTATVASFAADEGAALYKKKCAGCHGASGEGKSVMKAPALNSALPLTQGKSRTTSRKASPQAMLHTTKASLGLSRWDSR